MAISLSKRYYSHELRPRWPLLFFSKLHITLGIYCEFTELCITGLPGKPGIPTFTDVLDTSLVLHWTAPEDDGGAEITNYVIHCRPETEAEWKPATGDKVAKTEHKLTNLKTNVEYTFKVAAVNKVGTGPFSDPSAPVRIKEVVG